MSSTVKKSNCASCHARVLWTIVDKSGKRMPLDIGEDPEGNVILTGEFRNGSPVCHVLTKEDTVAEGTQRFVSHYATCPQARRWRR